ncbi:MAG: AMP-binding protein, partial [Planctomycetota bacterium]
RGRSITIVDALLRDRWLGGWSELIELAFREGVSSIDFRSSGTTQTPTTTTHQLSHLHDEAQHFAERFDQHLGGLQRFVAALPAHHIYGFIHSVLVPHNLGLPVVDAEFSLPSSVIRNAQPGDVIIATPTAWERLAAAASTPLPRGIHGVSSGAPMPKDLWTQLQTKGITSLTEVYGSTETAGIATRSDHDAPWSLLSTWRRVDETHVQRAADPTSHVQLPDRVAWNTDDTFTLQGRLDGAVQVAGVNVVPDAVSKAITAIPGVRACAVRPTGQGPSSRLKAFIVPESDHEATQLATRVRDWCTRTLPAPQRPVTITTGPAIPTGPLGKPCDWTDAAGYTTAMGA